MWGLEMVSYIQSFLNTFSSKLHANANETRKGVNFGGIYCSFISLFFLLLGGLAYDRMGA